jgi:RHS repeat-associated protein
MQMAICKRRLYLLFIIALFLSNANDIVQGCDLEAVNFGPDPRICPIGGPVNPTTGNMYLQHVDYTTSGLAKELSLVRTYNSRAYSGLIYNSPYVPTGIFGKDWTTPFDEYLMIFHPDNNLSVINELGLIQEDGSQVYFSPNNPSHSIFIPYMPPDTKSTITVDSSNGYNIFTLQLKNGSQHVFGPGGRLWSIVDRNGNITTFNRPDGMLRTVTAAGRTLTISYNSDDLVSSVSDALGTVATYTYEGQQLTSVTYWDSSSNVLSKYEYVYSTISGVPVKLMTAVRRYVNSADTQGHIIEAHAYDSSGRATTSEKDGGVELYALEYNDTTGVTTVTDALNRITKFTVDKTHGKNVVTLIEGPYCQQARTTQTRTYDDYLNLTSTIDQIGYQTTYRYDDRAHDTGNPIEIDAPTNTTNYSYNSFGQVLTESDIKGGIANTYDTKGNLLSTIDTTGTGFTFTYDSKGLLLSKTDALNHSTGYNYDQYGNLISMTNALNKTISFSPDVRGRLVSMTDELGHTTQYSYDLRDRLISTTYPDNTSTTRSYDLSDRLTSVTDARGRTTNYSYDNADRLIEIIDAEGKHITKSYDLMSNVIAQTEAATDPVMSRTTNYSYNDMDKLTNVIYPDTSPYGRLEVNYGYDSTGNLVSNSDTAGHTTTYVRDSGGRIIQSQDAAQHSTVMEYDLHNNITTLTDAKGNQYEFAYDYNNRRVSESRDNRTKTRYYIYNAAGNLVQRQECDETNTYYTYDALNRLTQITHPGNHTDAFTYDDASRMVTATNETGTVTLSYDNRNRVTGIMDVWNNQINYEYDANGNRTRMIIGSRSTYYQYNGVNELVSLSENTGNSATFGYDALGRISSTTINSLLIATYDHNPLDQLTNMNYQFGANTLANFQYSLSNAGQISSINDRSGTHQYGYDAIGQLTSATHSNPPQELFTYDQIGNHLNPDGTFPPPQGVTYQYNPKGELATRIDSVTQSPQPPNVSYAYDALGRLVMRTSGAEWTKYTYDGDDVVLDQNSDGSTVYYGNGPGIDNKLWYTPSSGSSVFFLKDHLNSTRALISSSGSIVSGSQIDYDSFGNPTNQIATRYTYAGREWDPDTQLYYYRARWYDPQARRFISEDPIGLAGGINLYAYVGNNPINLTDPSGLKSDFTAATRGLDIISKKDFCGGECGKFLADLAKRNGTTVENLINMIHEVASIAKLEDGTESTIPLNEMGFPGARDDAKGITTMQKWFTGGVEAASNVNNALIYLRPRWGGGLFHSKYADYYGNPSNYGLATLLHEILHKRMVSGKFLTHQNMFPGIDENMRKVLSNDPITVRIMRRCFPEI